MLWELFIYIYGLVLCYIYNLQMDWFMFKRFLKYRVVAQGPGSYDKALIRDITVNIITIQQCMYLQDSIVHRSMEKWSNNVSL